MRSPRLPGVPPRPLPDHSTTSPGSGTTAVRGPGRVGRLDATGADELIGVELLTPRERAVYTRWAVGHLTNGTRRGNGDGRRAAIAAELGIAADRVSTIWGRACERIRSGLPYVGNVRDVGLPAAFGTEVCPRCSLRGCDGLPQPIGVCLPASATHYAAMRIER